MPPALSRIRIGRDGSTAGGHYNVSDLGRPESCVPPETRYPRWPGQLVFEDAGILSVLWDRKLGTVLLLIVLYTFYGGIVGARRASQKVT